MFKYEVVCSSFGYLDSNLSLYAKEGWKLVSVVTNYRNLESNQFILFFEKELYKNTDQQK